MGDPTPILCARSGDAVPLMHETGLCFDKGFLGSTFVGSHQCCFSKRQQKRTPTRVAALWIVAFQQRQRRLQMRERLLWRIDTQGFFSSTLQIVDAALTVAAVGEMEGEVGQSPRVLRTAVGLQRQADLTV
ncbi:MAG: hypothetical protein BWZ07_03025 [Alphaproteobacteria bacterium ADurb.BinA280]|nr:MAG: hypothetical protein BWZ07_03025 [Alphaproteobacteria bacterium ADurb.BinA280]